MAFLSPSPMELVVILIIALLVLGPSRLPETARSLGRGMRELRDSLQGIGSDDGDDADARERREDAAIGPPPARRDDPGGLPVDPAVVMAQPYEDDPPGADAPAYDDDLPAADDLRGADDDSPGGDDLPSGDDPPSGAVQPADVPPVADR